VPDEELVPLKKSAVPTRPQKGRREVAALMAAARSLLSDRSADDGPAAQGLADLVARFDRDLRYLELSPAERSLNGAQSAKILGKTNQELGLPAEVWEPWDAAIRRVFAKGKPEKVMLLWPGPFGNRYFDCRLLPELYADGVVLSVLSVARDVTELKLAYAAENRARYVDDVLREATVALAGSLDRDTVFTTLLDFLWKIVPFDRACVMLLEESSRLSIRALFDGTRASRLPPEERPSIDPGEHKVIEDILENGTPILVSDVRRHPDWSVPLDSPAEASWMGIPLRTRGKVAGLFSLAKSEPAVFTEEHRRLAELMAAQASVAIENSILFEQMQDSSRRMRSLSRRLVAVQENERRHIARELHDDAGQALVSLRYGLRLLEKEIGEAGPAASHVAELRRRTDAVMDSLHRLAADLRPASLDHLGLDAALRQYSSSAGQKFGLAIRFKARGFDEQRLPTAVETALYRVVQEAVTNVVRHARATRVDLLVERRNDRVMVMIEDDGIGFDQHKLQRPDHLGLLGLRERAEALNGTLTVESSPGAGTTIVVEVSSADPNPDR
jgi:signal transduction histidine kinase